MTATNKFITIDNNIAIYSSIVFRLGQRFIDSKIAKLPIGIEIDKFGIILITDLKFISSEYTIIFLASLSETNFGVDNSLMIWPSA